MLKIVKGDGESSEKLLKKFSNRIKSRKLMQAFRGIRYFIQKPAKIKVRAAAVSREKHRAEAKKKEFLS